MLEPSWVCLCVGAQAAAPSVSDKTGQVIEIGQTESQLVTIKHMCFASWRYHACTLQDAYVGDSTAAQGVQLWLINSVRFHRCHATTRAHAQLHLPTWATFQGLVTNIQGYMLNQVSYTIHARQRCASCLSLPVPKPYCDPWRHRQPVGARAISSTEASVSARPRTEVDFELERLLRGCMTCGQACPGPLGAHSFCSKNTTGRAERSSIQLCVLIATLLDKPCQ